jgi:hypothetical protein
MFYVRPTGAVKPLKDPKMEDNVKILKMRKNSFDWSLEPITKCMHVMGVSIPPSSEEVKSCQLISFLSHLLFSIGIVPSVYSCYSSVLRC